jgi:hypothetical protein
MNRRKLVLRKETIRSLSNPELEQAAGGIDLISARISGCCPVRYTAFAGCVASRVIATCGSLPTRPCPTDLVC